MSSTMADLGVLLLRIAVAFILFAHATQKLLGWFRGPGLDKITVVFEALGQVPARPLAKLAAWCELSAALLLVLGIATPLGAAIGAGTMLVAGFAMTAKSGAVWNALGGGEYPLVLTVLALSLAFTGPGSISLDAGLGVPWYGAGGRAVVIGLVAVAVAILAAAPPIFRTVWMRRAVAADELAAGA
ncbi:DoxX family protein [Amycolatopsis rhabdoformis]|uniref:DoxX family protein n=1 Tax=Amycolatopsis rhabdoformis TaxID=1448059 RepID=A0ABZ1IIF5_9PSEU|nr:DoxX family protein [Amycolatopsis rhabdoformis]WSE34186.1 DoxX family protein [Amycolatopsis rhabdoformis]